VELTDISFELLKLREGDGECSLGRLTSISISCCLDKKNWLV